MDCVQVFSPDGKFLRKWGGKGEKDGQFKNPAGIAVSLTPRDQEVYVMDVSNDRVQVFSLEGKFLRKWGSKGEKDGEFNCPFALALSSSHEVYVADTDNHRVQVFTPEGKFLRKWGQKGSKCEFIDPLYIAVKKNAVYVSDKNHIQVFTTQGKFLQQWDFKLSDIALDGEKAIVVDRDNHQVQVFT